jgi:hypothetical protein
MRQASRLRLGLRLVSRFSVRHCDRGGLLCGGRPRLTGLGGLVRMVNNYPRYPCELNFLGCRLCWERTNASTNSQEQETTNNVRGYHEEGRRRPCGQAANCSAARARRPRYLFCLRINASQTPPAPPRLLSCNNDLALCVSVDVPWPSGGPSPVHVSTVICIMINPA